MPWHLRRAAACVLSTLVGVVVVAAEPTWYPPSEPSPFLPTAAHWINGGSPAKTTCFRGSWELAAPVRRAVLAVAPRQTVRVWVNGTPVAEAYSSHQATPEFIDLTRLLQPGRVHIAARVHCEWRPELYLQLRVEYRDGPAADLTTGAGWQWCDQPAAGWETEAAAAGDWRPVEEGRGYATQPESVWGQEFALLPRDLLRTRFAPHNERLQREWAQECQRPGFTPAAPPERPEWAAAFRDFARVDEADGQLRDGSGRVRHLFFTIYGQPSGLSLYEMDLQRLEQDLDLMAKADVHLYVRMLGWNALLTETGEWADLPHQPGHPGSRSFRKAVDLLDHFVERARAHGRYIVFEGDFLWSAHPLVPAPYRSRYHLYPEVLQAQALATRRILNRYRNCTNVLGMMVGEEDIVLEHDLDNPHQQALFADFLKRKYGTLEAFKAATPWGYDYADTTGYRPGTWRGERWEGNPEVPALVPAWRPRAGVFDKLADFSQVPLPRWPWLLDPGPRRFALGGCTSHNQFSPDDPLWIDFYELREDELLFGMLVHWARIVRQGLPHQLLFYSNAQDLTASWHFLHLYRRADLPFDVIGVGCHDSGLNPGELPPYATVRKAIKVISAYRPYALSPGSPARGIASGEGEGGRTGQPEEILNYYRGALFDELGGGVAWTQTYTWQHISGAEAGEQPHETPLLKWLGEFLPEAQGVPFPLRRPVQVLVVRNTNLAHSNLSGLDYANTRAVAESLSQLNVEFDIVMDRDLVYRAGPAEGRYRVDLASYRLVILPSVATDLPDAAWAVLDRWLRDRAAPGRVLALGWIGKRGPRLQPTTVFHPTLRDWLGAADYAATVSLAGKQTVTLISGGAPQALAVDFGRIPPCGVFANGRTILSGPGREALGVAATVGGGSCYAFGFPLGLAHEPLWGLEPTQEPRDALTPLFELLTTAARVDRPVRAPHNLRVYVSQGAQMVLIRERAGLPTEAEVALRAAAGVHYPGIQAVRGPDGYTRLKVRLRPWEGVWLKAGK